MPFFSIIVVTRNRASMLQEALASVRSQDFQDFEVLVYDNASDDGTTEAIARLRDSRIRHIRLEEPGLVQDCLERGFREAKGKYVRSLCDDDCIPARGLTRPYRILQATGTPILSFSVAYYYDADWKDPHVRNVVEVPLYTGRLLRFDSGERLREQFREATRPALKTGVINSFYSTEFLRALFEERGSLLWNQYWGDHSLTVLALTRCAYCHHVDEPLVLMRQWPSTVTSEIYRIQRGESDFARQYDRWLREASGRLLERVPLRLPLPICFSAATLLEAAEKLNLKLDFNWARFLEECRVDLGEVSLQDGSRAEDWWNQFERLSGTSGGAPGENGRNPLPPGAKMSSLRSVGRRVWLWMSSRFNRLCIQARLIGRMRERAVRQWRLLWGLRGGRWIRGRWAGFGTILECARKLHGL